MTKRIIILACSVSAVAFGQERPQHHEEAPPQPVKVSSVELFGQSGGSLMRASTSAAAISGQTRTAGPPSYFHVSPPEPKTLKKHDFITIIVSEQSDIASDGKSDLKKNSDMDAHIDQMIKLKLSNYGVQGGAQGPTPPAIKYGLSRDMAGTASLEQKDLFTMRITAEVIDVKPNGTVAIQARKHIKHDEEEQDYLMTGMIRSADVTPDNSVLSSQINDMSIESTHKGAVADTTKRGLVPKLLDFVNPF